MGKPVLACIPSVIYSNWHLHLHAPGIVCTLTLYIYVADKTYVTSLNSDEHVTYIRVCT